MGDESSARPRKDDKPCAELPVIWNGRRSFLSISAGAPDAVLALDVGLRLLKIVFCAKLYSREYRLSALQDACLGKG